MRRGVVGVLVLSQFSLTTTAMNQRQLCGADGYSRFRPNPDIGKIGYADCKQPSNTSTKSKSDAGIAQSLPFSELIRVVDAGCTLRRR